MAKKKIKKMATVATCDIQLCRVTLLVKLGSALVHADEFMSDSGHALDKHEFDRLMQDAEVVSWMRRMDSLALIPKKRN